MTWRLDVGVDVNVGIEVGVGVDVALSVEVLHSDCKHYSYQSESISNLTQIAHTKPYPNTRTNG